MVTRTQLATLTEARLRTLPNVAGYLNTLPETPPTISADDLRVRPYWVLHTGAGQAADRRTSGDIAGLTWGFKLDAVVGDPAHFAPLVDALDTLLSGWRPLADVDTSRCWLDDTVDPGEARTDRSQTPPRIWTPLYFQILL